MRIMWVVTPTATSNRIILTIKIFNAKTAEQPIVIHSRVMAKTLTFIGIPLPSL